MDFIAILISHVSALLIRDYCSELFMRFINCLRKLLISQHKLLDLSETPDAANFDFLGLVDRKFDISLIALVSADKLTVKQIAELCDKFFETTRSLPSELHLKSHGRNPNGLLGFVLDNECPPHMVKFIRKQSKISHSALRGGVVVSWVFDLKLRQIYTHENPVSLIPPVVILADQVFPGLDYLKGFLQSQSWSSKSDHDQAHDRKDISKPPGQYNQADRANTGVGQDKGSQIKILFLTANPKDTSKLRLDEECRAIEEALNQSEFRSRFDIKQHWAVEVRQLQKYFLRHKPDIVHFSGHSGTSGGILLEDSDGYSHSVSVEALSQLFSILKDHIRCVMLNACYSEEQAKAIAKHIDAVIGIKGSIERPAAIAFATAFYQALGYRRDIKTAFDLGCLQISLENLGDKDPLKLLAMRVKPEDITFIE